MKINLNLDNYPNLKALAEQDATMFGAFLKGIMTFSDNALKEKYPSKSREHFNLSLPELMTQIIEAFFDYKGITSHHHSPQEAKMLEMIEMENNPLASNKFYRVEDGEQVSREEFFGGDLSVKEWLQGMLYAGKYVSHEDLSRFMTLGEFDLVERIKTDRIIELLKVQPALAYQAERDMVLGKRVEGTGFFDCGKIISPLYLEKCQVCMVEGHTQVYEGYVLCNNCQGAIKI